MTDRRCANINWNVANETGDLYNDMRNGVTVAVIMDIRDELQKLNRLLHCRNFTEMPLTLRRIDRRLGIRWAKKRKPRAKR